MPSTFRQPDDPPPGVLTLPLQKGDIPAVRVAIRGGARGDKDFAASTLFASVLESRLRAKLPSAVAANTFVRDAAYVLPGQITIGFASTEPFKTGSKDNDIVKNALADAVTDAELVAAKAAVAAEWSKRPNEDLWLDLDTYKLPDPMAERKTLDATTLVEMNAYAEKVRQAPRAYVIVAAASK